MKKFFVYLMKCIAAGAISLTILSMFTLIYYNPPVSVSQPELITNSKYLPDSRWSYMTEGLGYGKIDNIGYNNTYYDDLSEPDIVFVGSSHLEALNVPHDANFIYLLNKKFNEDNLTYNNYKCLNLGKSGHFFKTSASNFEYVADKYNDAKYIVIETSDVKLSPSDLDGIMKNEFHSYVSEHGMIYKAVQKVPYLRLLYKKIEEMKKIKNESTKTDEEYDIDVYKEKMTDVLEKLVNKSNENGIKLIILMHGNFETDENGNLITGKEEEYKNAFKECCEKLDIKVVDVVHDMIENYKKTFELPYGFSNTTPGVGHLNKAGHRIISDVLYDEINQMEERK